MNAEAFMQGRTMPFDLKNGRTHRCAPTKFPTNGAKLISVLFICAFLFIFLEIADFIFDRSPLRIFGALLDLCALLVAPAAQMGRCPIPRKGAARLGANLFVRLTPRQRTGAGPRVRPLLCDAF
jgi:hypothetical protein